MASSMFSPFSSPRRTLARVLAAAAFCVLMAAPALRADGYVYGGRIPLPDDLARQLDERAGTLRLGLNGERLRGSGLHPEPVVEAMIFLADAVEAGLTPGAVVYIDSMTGDNMAIGAGALYRIPEAREADWAGVYELGELTGPIIVTPLALRALERGELRLRDTVAAYLPRFEETPVGELTVEQLLRHSSGLPATLDVPDDVRTREALLDLLAEMEPETSPGSEALPSGINFLLLGLMLEETLGKPVHRFAKEHYLHPLGMVNTTCDLPAQLRTRCAAGSMSDWHGRMVWGEAEDPGAFILGFSAGHGGLISGPDDLGIFARAMIHSWNIGIDDFATTGTMRLATRPDMNVLRGENQGLGWQLNGFGAGSFGWVAENGSALWIDPKRQIFVVVLANAHHPDGNAREFREEFLPRFLQRLRLAVPDTSEEARALPGAPVDRPRDNVALYLRNEREMVPARPVG